MDRQQGRYFTAEQWASLVRQPCMGDSCQIEKKLPAAHLHLCCVHALSHLASGGHSRWCSISVASFPPFTE